MIRSYRIRLLILMNLFLYEGKLLEQSDEVDLGRIRKRHMCETNLRTKMNLHRLNLYEEDLVDHARIPYTNQNQNKQNQSDKDTEDRVRTLYETLLEYSLLRRKEITLH
jgi:hypothetical protein